MESRFKRILASTLAIVIALPLGWIGAGRAETASASAGDTATVVEWNFPLNPDDAVADEAIEINESKTLTAVGTDAPTFSTSGASTKSARAEGWNWAEGDNTKYWQVEFGTTGYDSLLLSSKQRSSDTGPKYFQVQYKIGEGEWSDLAGGIVNNNDNWTSGVLSEVALPEALANQPSVSLRWIMTSNLSVDQEEEGSEVASAGASRIDDIVITGEELPEEPVVTLIGADPQVIERGEDYVELGARASDYQDGDLTEEIVIDASEVDTAVAGSYTVIYSVTDADDNTTSVERTVNVTDSAAPTMAINDLITNDTTPELTGTIGEDSEVIVTVDGEEYEADVVGGLWTALVTDELAEGTYETAVTATDPSENTSGDTGSLTIDTTDPVLADLADVEAAAEVEVSADAADASGIATYEWSTVSGPGLVTYDTAENTAMISANANGEYEIQVTVTDNAGNFVTKTFTLVWNASANITEEDNTAVIPAEASGDAEIIIADGVADPELDLSAFAAINEDGTVTVEIPDTLNITTQGTVEGSPVVINIAGGTEITGPTDWDGILDLSRASVLGSVVLPVSPGQSAGNVLVLELGLSSGSLTFDGPVKIELGGLGGQRIGYISEGVFVEITTVCDDIDNPTTFSATGECKAVTADGVDLVVWTKHLTQFATYLEVAVPSPVFQATATVENNEKIIKIEWLGVGGGAEEYEILVNGIRSKVVAIANDAGLAYVYKVKVNDFAKYSVLIRAKKAGAYSVNTSLKYVEFTAPAPVAIEPPVPSAEPASITSPLPAKAQAAGPKVEEKKPEEPAGADDGIIKGEEIKDENESETNWTPWIVLLVLILLAGAVTGGYFYWFAGKEEVAKESPKPSSRDLDVAAAQRKTQKKKKRW